MRSIWGWVSKTDPDLLLYAGVAGLILKLFHLINWSWLFVLSPFIFISFVAFLVVTSPVWTGEIRRYRRCERTDRIHNQKEQEQDADPLRNLKRKNVGQTINQ